MQTIEALRARIDSAKDLQSVVSTMKGMAAVNIRQYERAVEALENYNRTIELGFRVLLGARPAASLETPDEEPGRIAALIFGSDQGMCGPLNREIVSHALQYLERLPSSREVVFAAVGARATAEIQAAGRRLAGWFRLPSSVAGLTPAVEDLLVQIEHWRFEEKAGRILLFHHRPKSGASYEPKTVSLLPMDAEWLRRMRAAPWPTHILPTHFMEWRKLFAALVRQYLFVSVFRSLAESLASENASRLASMQSAESNIEEKIDDLQARYHRKRQAAITEELLDVISGFEALGAD